MNRIEASADLFLHLNTLGQYSPGADIGSFGDRDSAIRNVYGDWPQSVRQEALRLEMRLRPHRRGYAKRLFIEGSDPNSWRLKPRRLTKEEAAGMAEKMYAEADPPARDWGPCGVPDNVFGGLNWDN
jgi:hypothetical protein